MKTNKVGGILFYLAAIINFTSADHALAVIWLALGSTFLCLGSRDAKKAKESKNGEEKK